MGCGVSAPPSQPPPLGPKAEGFEHAVVKSLYAPQASKGSWTDLHEQAEKGNVAEVKRNLQYTNANVGDEKCWTPLLEATECGKVGVVQALLEGNADPNIADKDGWTPLMAAAEKGQVAVAMALLKFGGKVNWQDRKQDWTCTMEAAEKGYFQLVQIFVEAQADLNARDKRGWTPLMAACEGGNVECVKLIWIQGAEHNLESDYHKGGWTAIEEAKLKKNKEVLNFMEPIIEAERHLKMMIDTDDWKPTEALGYLEKAQQVYCLRGTVARATARLTEVLQQHILDNNAKDREQCLDLLLTHDSHMFFTFVGNEEKSMKNNMKPELADTITEMCRKRLSTTSSGDSVLAIKWAISSAVRSKSSNLLPEEMDAAKSRYKSLLNVPDGWDIEAMAQNMVDGRMLHREPVNDPDVIKQMQMLLDATFLKRYTRDRRGEAAPDKLELQKVVSVQNDQTFQEYMLKSGALPAKGAGPDPMPTIYTMKDVCPCLPALNPAIGETWLFHGTSEAGAMGITGSDFRLNLAGSNAGTLYGSGIYFADSCSKSDEYCSPNDQGMRILILCRVSLGRVLYTDEVAPDTNFLTKSCITGVYDSVLGDREKCRGTYKEFIVFDEDQAYPEFLLYYKRVYHKR